MADRARQAQRAGQAKRARTRGENGGSERGRRARKGEPEGWAQFYRVVKRIPEGRVSTYGAIAALAGRPRAARHVGYALAALRGTAHKVPWQRVLGAKTRAYAVVTIRDPVGGAVQRELLEQEGVVFDALGRVAMAKFGWGQKPVGAPRGTRTGAKQGRRAKR